jgi:hypothetical protein
MPRGLSTELLQASRTCTESQKAGLTPHPNLEWECVECFFEIFFFFEIWKFLFLNSEYETEYFIFYFLQFQWLGLYMYYYEVPLCSLPNALSELAPTLVQPCFLV